MSRQFQQLRSVIWPLLNPDVGFLFCGRFAWRDIEIAPGSYDLSTMEEMIRKAKDIKRCVLLHIEPKEPFFVKDAQQAFIALIRAAGKSLSREAALLGVDAVCPGNEADLPRETLAGIADAFRSAFPETRVFVRSGSRLAPFFSGGGPVGLIVEGETASDGENAWQRMPLRMAVDPDDPSAVQRAVDTHISILETKAFQEANRPSFAGYRFQLCSLETDDSAVETGKIPVRAVFANAGGLPCYSDGEFRLRLQGSGIPDVREYRLPLRPQELLPGARKSVEYDADISGLSAGEYDVHIGLFLKGTEYPVSFGIEGRISDGYYEGRLILRL